tara:strand:+ start:820 stop:1896 length:1077 start_codon:yes stop_codon:yes gene_type:complete
MTRPLELVQSETSKNEYGGLDLKAASAIPAKRINWFWPKMLAKGKFHVFAGDSGIGKTQICLNIAATISKGGIFSGQSEPCEQGKVLYLTGEDDPSDTIKPRLMACGANQDNVSVLGPLMADGSLFSLQRHLDIVSDIVSDDGDYKLFIIDPVTAFCGDQFDNNSVTSVRGLAAKLKAFAEDTGLAVIGLNHLTKDEQRSAVNRILGSGAWVHSARVVVGAALVDGKYYFGKWKANITDCEPVYPYQMNNRPVEDLGHVHYIDFDDPLLGRTLSEFQPCSTGRGATGATVRDILEKELADGEWKDKDDLVAAVKSEVNCSVRTIQRIALDELKVEHHQTNTSPQKSRWRLPVTQGGQS